MILSEVDVHLISQGQPGRGHLRSEPLPPIPAEASRQEEETAAAAVDAAAVRRRTVAQSRRFQRGESSSEVPSELGESLRASASGFEKPRKERELCSGVKWKETRVSRCVLLSQEFSDPDHEAESCESVLVYTGVYSRNRDYNQVSEASGCRGTGTTRDGRILQTTVGFFYNPGAVRNP